MLTEIRNFTPCTVTSLQETDSRPGDPLGLRPLSNTVVVFLTFLRYWVSIYDLVYTK